MTVYNSVSNARVPNYLQKYANDQTVENPKEGNTAFRGDYTVTNPALEADTVEIGSEEKPKSSHKLLWGTLAVAVATLGTCVIAGKGNIKKGAEKVYDWFCKKIGRPGKSTEKEITNVLTARRVNGENIYTIPRDKTTITGQKEVQAFARENGINLGRSRNGFRAGKSQINKCEFSYVADAKKKTEEKVRVIYKRGEKFDIVNKEGKSVLEDWSKNPERAEDLKKITDRTVKIGEGNVKGNYSAFKNLRNMEYTTDLGDDVLTVSRSGVEARLDVVGGPRHSRKEITQMTTLQRYKEDSDVVKKYFEEHPELKEKFTAECLKEGKLPEGMQVGKFTKIIGDKKFFFENGEVKGVIVKGKHTVLIPDKNAVLREVTVPGSNIYYPKGSQKYEELLGADSKYEHKAEIEKLIKDVYTDKSLIPEGATIQTV